MDKSDDRSKANDLHDPTHDIKKVHSHRGQNNDDVGHDTQRPCDPHASSR